MATAPGTVFGELLKQHRLAAGLTQEELAERAGLSARAVTYLERGARSPYRDTVRRLADALALTPDDRALLEAARSPVGSPAPSTDMAGAPSPLVIVYVEADAELATRLGADLQAQGVACRLADAAGHGAGRGTSPNRNLVRAVQSSVLVASPQASRSRWVAEYLRVAEMYRRTVYALWVGGERWAEAAPPGYHGPQGIDARHGRYEDALRDLVALLEQGSVRDAARDHHDAMVPAPDRTPRKPL